jgi:thiamine biosynthesis protein ThiS
VDLRVNGKPKAIDEGSTISDLIEVLGLRSRSVAVEHNGEAVARSRYASVRLRDGDVVEVVRAVPGG